MTFVSSNCLDNTQRMPSLDNPSSRIHATANSKVAEYLRRKLETVAGETAADGGQKETDPARSSRRKPGEFRPTPTRSAFSRKQFDVEEALSHMGSVQVQQLKYALGGFPTAAASSSTSPISPSMNRPGVNVVSGTSVGGLAKPTAQEDVFFPGATSTADAPARGNGFLHRSWRTDAFLHQRIVEQQRRELRQKSSNVKWTTLLFTPTFSQSGERQGPLKVAQSSSAARSGSGTTGLFTVTGTAPIEAPAISSTQAATAGWVDGELLEAHGKALDLAPTTGPTTATTEAQGELDAHFEPAPPSPSRIRPSTAPSRRKPSAVEPQERRTTATATASVGPTSSSLVAQREAWKWVLDEAYRNHPSGSSGQRLNGVNGVTPSLSALLSSSSSSMVALCLRGQHLEPPTPKKITTTTTTTTTSPQRPWSAGVARPAPPQSAAAAAGNQPTARRPQSAKVRSEETFPRGAVEIPRHVANNSQWLREGIHPASDFDSTPSPQRSAGTKPLFPAHTVPLVRALAGGPN